MTKGSKGDSMKACPELAAILDLYSPVKPVFNSDTEVGIKGGEIFKAILTQDCINAVDGKQNLRISILSDEPLKDLQEGESVSVSFTFGGNGMPKVDFDTSLRLVPHPENENEKILAPDIVKVYFDATHTTQNAGDNESTFDNMPEYS